MTISKSFSEATKDVRGITSNKLREGMDWWSETLDGVAATSVCWFFRWAFNGMGDGDIEVDAKRVFNNLMPGGKSFDWWKSRRIGGKRFEDYAVDNRYPRNAAHAARVEAEIAAELVKK
jgi:hypothetical protein